jgi:hypothetical protein
VERPVLDPTARAKAVALLVRELPYHMHARFLGALISLALGNRAETTAAYVPAAAAARQLLREAGLATDADLLDLQWDEVILDGARLRVQVARN